MPKIVRARSQSPADLGEEYSFSQLQGIRFPRLKWLVEGIVVEGLTLLAAKPKIGKSWMVLDIALAVASGGNALTKIPCDEMTALYYALEDKPRRMRQRGRKLGLGDGDWPGRLFVRHSLSRLDKGGRDEIRTWVKKRKGDLVIIDTYNYVRPPRKASEEAYAADYQWLSELQRLASELSISIIVVHHVRKAEAGDPMDLISGSTGIQAAVDTMLVIDKKPDGITLHGRGRDIDREIELGMTFNRGTCRWEIEGPAWLAHMDEERRKVYDVLFNKKRTMTPTQVAKLLGKEVGTITTMLHRMASDGHVEKVRRGEYRVLD